MLSAPTRAHSAQHHYSPTQTSRRTSQDGYVDTYDDALLEKKPETGFFGGHKDPVKGRKWDHARNGDPVVVQSGDLPKMIPWRTYVKSSMYGPPLGEDAKHVNNEFLQQQTPGYEKPWRGDIEGNEESETFVAFLHNRKRQRTLIQRLQVSF